MSRPLLVVEPVSDLTEWAESCERAKAECLLLTAKTDSVSPRGVEVIHAHALTADSMVEAGKRRHARGIWSDSLELQSQLLEAAERLHLPNAHPAASPGLIHLLAVPPARAPLTMNPLDLAPDLAQAERIAETRGMPVWVRALGTGGRSHCRLIEHTADLPLAFESAHRRFDGGLVALQQPLDGACYRVPGFKVNRDFFPVEVLSECFIRGAFRVPRAWTLPCGLGGGEFTEVIALSKKAAAALPPCHGYMEFEIVLDGGHPVLNNITMPPAPHPLLVSMARCSLGIDLRAQCLRVALGQTPDLSPTRGLGAAACFLSARSGMVEEIRHLEQAAAIPGVVSIVMRAKIGDTLGHIVDDVSREKVGCAISTGPTPAAAELALERVCETIEVVTNPML